MCATCDVYIIVCVLLYYMFTIYKVYITLLTYLSTPYSPSTFLAVVHDERPGHVQLRHRLPGRHTHYDPERGVGADYSYTVG